MQTEPEYNNTFCVEYVKGVRVRDTEGAREKTRTHTKLILLSQVREPCKVQIYTHKLECVHARVRDQIEAREFPIKILLHEIQ